MSADQTSLRILAISDHWPGAASYGFVRAFRRAGHSVSSFDARTYLPVRWKSTWLRALRRGLEPMLVAEHTRALIAEARHHRPHLFFAFKGPYVTVEAMRAIKEAGAISINFYPDTSLTDHGRYLPKALPHYDWVFTTKTFGPDDMRRILGITTASFLPHAFDPEVHSVWQLDASDVSRYAADVSFIGAWTPKKEQIVLRIQDALPGITMRIWGAQWENASRRLQPVVEHQEVWGREYAKCILASRINLGLLIEAQPGASCGDLITSRTFEIPATGGFMLHERTSELSWYFEEDKECAAFSSEEELLEKIRYYLSHETDRRQIAEAGRRRALESGYSMDSRVEQVVAKYRELAQRPT